MKTKLYFSLLAAILLLGSCEKSDPTTDQSGNVVLCNDDGLLSSHDNIKVSIEGTDLSTFTDASGNWTIKGVKASKQTIVFEKDGFAKYKEEITPSLDNTNYMGSFNLPERAKYTIKNFSVDLLIGGEFKITGNYSFPSQNDYDDRGCVVLFGKSNSVSSDPQSWIYSIQEWSPGDSTISITYPLSELYQNGFIAGNSVYVVAYGSPYQGGRVKYYDANTDKYVFGALSVSPSNMVTIQLP